MTTQSTHMDTPKGRHGEWAIYKYEGRPSLALPDLPHWWASKGKHTVSNATTKRELIEMIERYDSVTDEEAAATRAMLAKVLGLA